ncbi:hypothetical protein DSO57_1023259 [Entomophthora muscae]|uniref:Uncharacterized protein n=1 Tax=Entomophthora muscae TaxID=34485 RepID=A0ACC2RU18_9FUNG|nr:hypothetical protein DSO57_1023259 [Entomophthora muscae]
MKSPIFSLVLLAVTQALPVKTPRETYPSEFPFEVRSQLMIDDADINLDEYMKTFREQFPYVVSADIAETSTTAPLAYKRSEPLELGHNRPDAPEIDYKRSTTLKADHKRPAKH